MKTLRKKRSAVLGAKKKITLKKGMAVVRRSKTANTTKKTASGTVKKVSRGRKKAIAKKLILKKFDANPILAPRNENGWEAWQTFNPGTILLKDTVHFLYRAIGTDGLSRIGYAASNDGFVLSDRCSHPVYEHPIQEKSQPFITYASGGSWGGVEDPRIVRVDNEDILYMTYTACNGDLRVGLTSIAINDFLNKQWRWTHPKLISPPGEVHKNWLLFPEKIHGKYALLHSINPEISIAYLDDLSFDGSEYIQSCHGGKPRKNCWDKWIRGVGPVPIKTKYGWLVFYHAMNDDWSKYRVGAVLLDLNDPHIVLARSRVPILEPSEVYENSGFKAGVVYASGAVVKEGSLLIYYGSADSYVCVAQAPFEEFVEALHSHREPILRGRKIKK